LALLSLFVGEERAKILAPTFGKTGPIAPHRDAFRASCPLDRAGPAEGDEWTRFFPPAVHTEDGARAPTGAAGGRPIFDVDDGGALAVFLESHVSDGFSHGRFLTAPERGAEELEAEDEQ